MPQASHSVNCGSRRRARFSRARPIYPVNPVSDYFSLGQGTPQVWELNNYAAGLAFCELRITKTSTIQPSTPDLSSQSGVGLLFARTGDAAGLGTEQLCRRPRIL